MKSSYLNLGKYYGILSGVASSLSYAVAGLLWAIAAEKYNRKYLITISVYFFTVFSTSDSYALRRCKIASFKTEEKYHN